MGVDISSVKKLKATIPGAGKGKLPGEVVTAVGVIITKKDKTGAQSKTVEDVLAVHGTGPFANIGVSVSTTINTGNFENIKVQVDLHVPCEMTQKDIEDTFIFASEWVDDKISKLVEAAKGGTPDGG